MQLGIAEESDASEADGTRAAAAAAAQQQRDDDDDDNNDDDEEGRGGGAGSGSSSEEGAATGVVDDDSRDADGDGDYDGDDGGDDNTNSMKKFCADFEVTARERLDALSEHRRGVEAEGAEEEGDVDKDYGIVYSDEESGGHDGERETDDAPFVAPDDHDGDGNDNDKDNDADEDHREAKREEFRRRHRAHCADLDRRRAKATATAVVDDASSCAGGDDDGDGASRGADSSRGGADASGGGIAFRQLLLFAEGVDKKVHTQQAWAKVQKGGMSLCLGDIVTSGDARGQCMVVAIVSDKLTARLIVSPATLPNDLYVIGITAGLCVVSSHNEKVPEIHQLWLTRGVASLTKVSNNARRVCIMLTSDVPVSPCLIRCQI